MKRALGLLAVVIAVAAAPASAQKADIMPFAGLRFGGGLENLKTGQRYSIAPSLSYGALGEFAIGHGNRFTVTYSRQDTQVDTLVGTAGIPVLIQFLEFGGTRDMKPAGATQPYVTGSLGLMFASVPGTLASSTTRFSVSAALGAKYPAGARLSLRAEARGFLGFVGESNVAGTCGGGGCAIAFQGTGLLQGEVAAGINFRF